MPHREQGAGPVGARIYLAVYRYLIPGLTRVRSYLVIVLLTTRCPRPRGVSLHPRSRILATYRADIRQRPAERLLPTLANRRMKIYRSDLLSPFLCLRSLTIISLSEMGWVRGDAHTHIFLLQKGANLMVEDTLPLGPVTRWDANRYASENLRVATIFTSL